ncbi:MAG: hypothetical protein MK108_01825 [Mariniblastus sp.]|nr:hypothetical protein [Mariniblastus sp.]
MRRHLSLLFSITVACCWFSPGQEARAGGGPENLMLVVNADDPSSMLLANHYVRLRKIPPCNVVYLTGVPQSVDMALETFQVKIMTPILQRINQSRVNRQIDYIVYSSGFPTVVKIGPHVKKMNEWLVANGQAPLPANLFKPMASITATTYFFSQVMKNDPAYISLTANGYMSGATNVLLRSPFVGDDQIEFDRSIRDYNAGQYDQAIQTLLPLQKKNPGQVAVQYWLARCYGMKKDPVQTTEWIAKCIRNGWCYAGYTRADPAFESLLDNRLFTGLLKRMPNQEFEYLPTRSFDSRLYWGRNGFPNSAGQGHRYVLSTMLSVTRGLGMSERQAVEFLERSARSDHTHPQGVFYFSRTSNVRTTTRMASFAGAIDELAKLGFQGEVIETVMPMKKDNVIGATLGVGKLDWKSSQSQIIPGAIVENLTSFGGKFGRKNAQTNASHFLKYGAAGSSGTVVEPYALQAKFPHPRIHVHYARGCSLAEAFYQSVQGPFQLLILGDALCRPFAKAPRMTVSTDFSGRLAGEVDYQVETEQSPVPVEAVQTYLDGRLLSQTTDFERMVLDTTEIGDGYHELRLVAIGRGPIRSRASQVFELEVDNHGHSALLQCERREIGEGQLLEVSVEAGAAESIAIYCNTRRLGNREGGRAVFKIDTKKLGRGPVQLQAVATIDGSEVRSQPFSLLVTGEILDQIPASNSPE